METIVMILVACIREIVLSRATLQLENVALRQQVAVLKRERPRPWLRPLDRVFWVFLPGILAAAHALLGDIEKAQMAFRVFSQGYMGTPDLARSMISFPFSDPSVLERLTQGLELAGVNVWFSREDGGYLPLNALNRLTGNEIQSLFLGKKIDGKGFWLPNPWQRRGGADGPVHYAGFAIQPGVPENVTGTSRVEDDMLCERWSESPNPLEYCSVIFRVPGANARIRWGNYVLVTDAGPNPFNLAQ